MKAIWWFAIALFVKFTLTSTICSGQHTNRVLHNTKTNRSKPQARAITAESSKIIADKLNLIAGRWEGNDDTIKVTMVFTRSDTAYFLSKGNQKNLFYYHFISPHIITFKGSNKSYHYNTRYYVQELTNSSFKFVEYPINYHRESIDIIEGIWFHKKH